MTKLKNKNNSVSQKIILKIFSHRLIYGSIVIGLGLTGCSKQEERRMPPVPVTAAVAEIQSAPLALNFVGKVEPIETVSIKAQVGGVITNVNFSEGQEVQAGQILFQIDPRPFQVSLDAAKAQLEKDKAQASNAEVQAKRYADLVKKEYVTQEQYDTARTQAEMLKSVVLADEAAVEQAKLNLAYASITAPISGRTGSLLMKRGNVVRANDATLVVINQMRPINVSFSIPGNQLPLVQKYSSKSRLEVKVKPSRNGDNSEIEGVLTFFDNMVDSATGTVILRAEFANKKGILWPGQFVDTQLILTVDPAVLTVPAGAVVAGQEGTFVFVISEDKKAEKRLVKVNRSLDSIVVIEEGLKTGEMVVTDGQMRLIPGATVIIKAGLQDKAQAK
jgi:multidrug efflux system membrane fusion protein